MTTKTFGTEQLGGSRPGAVRKRKFRVPKKFLITYEQEELQALRRIARAKNIPIGTLIREITTDWMKERKQ